MALGTVVTVLGLPQLQNPALWGTKGSMVGAVQQWGWEVGQLLSRPGGRAGGREWCLKDHRLVLKTRRKQSMHLTGGS